MICRHFAQSFAFAGVALALAAANLAAQAPGEAPAESPAVTPDTAVSGAARLQVPPGATTTLKSVETLPVRGVAVAAGEPVRKGVVLLEMDLSKLQRELDETSKELRLLQDEARRRISGRENRSASEAVELAMRQADAQRDLVTIQTSLSTALPRAPEDGFVVRYFYAVGAEAKRRKPILEFIAAGKTTLALALSPAAAAGAAATMPPGTRVVVFGADDPQRRFRATVETSTRAADGGVALTLRPLELSFLALDRPATVSLTLDPRGP